MAPECQTTTDSSQPAPVSCPPGYYAAPFFPGADPCQPIPPCPDGTVPIASPEGSRGGQWCNPVPSSTGRNPREILPIGRPGGSDVLDPTMDVGPGSTGGGGGSVRTAEVAVDLTPAGDIVTLVDPDAPDWAKVMAGISLALGPLPVGGLSRILAGATRAAGPTAKQLAKFGKQLSEHGPRSLRRSQAKIGRRLTEHRQKLEQIREAGGHTSSVEREIRNFERELEAIDRVLRGGS